MNKAILIPLTKTLQAKLSIVRKGQEKINISDEMGVTAILYLPCDRRSPNLASELQFGSRVISMEYPLTSGWGLISNSEPNYQYNYKYFSAPTWIEAEDIAWKYLNKQVNKIIRALNIRAKALVNADQKIKWWWPIKNLINFIKGGLKRSGVYDLSVKAIDGIGASAVAIGDKLYYVAADTPKISKKDTGVFYGYAMESITAGATATIMVINPTQHPSTPEQKEKKCGI